MAKTDGLIGSLTPKAHRVLIAIREHIEAHGFAPTMEELSSYTRIKGRGEVHRIVIHLEEQQYITREHGRARGINVTARGMQVKRGTAYDARPAAG